VLPRPPWRLKEEYVLDWRMWKGKELGQIPYCGRRGMGLDWLPVRLLVTLWACGIISTIMWFLL